jgi:hypothetical protein
MAKEIKRYYKRGSRTKPEAGMIYSEPNEVYVEYVGLKHFGTVTQYPMRAPLDSLKSDKSYGATYEDKYDMI